MPEADNSQLSYDEQSTIIELADKHQVTQKNSRLLIKYYTHFVKTLNIQNPTSTLCKTLGQIALIFTQKSNFYKTVQGQQCPGICFSMNDILKSKSYSQISNLVLLANQVLETVKFKQINLKTQTYKLMRQIEQGLNQVILFEKLCWVFMKNTLENSSQSQSYKQRLINFSWYLYIDIKTNCFQKHSQFQFNKILMVSVLEMIILNSLTHITPLILQKNSPQKYNLNFVLQKKEIMSTILEILLKEAQINSSQIVQYQEINEIFNNYFDSLVSDGIIKSFSQTNFDFLCQISLDINFRKIDRKISKEIKSNQIDLRRLISYELALEKDHKKTAIEDKLIIKHKKHQKSKNQNQQPSKKYKSHRVLDLQNCEIEMSSSSVITESQIILPPNVILDNKMRMSAPGIHLRSQKDELKRFLIQKTRQYMAEVSAYEPSIVSYIQNTYNRMNETVQRNRTSLPYPRNQNVFHAYEFYTYLAEHVWMTGERLNTQYILEQSDSTHECLLVISMGTILLSEGENQSLNPFVNLLAQLKPDMMDFFYTLIFVMQMDFPLKLKNSLKELMETLINEFMWTDRTFIDEITHVAQHFSEIYSEKSEKLALACILQKISKYVQEKVKFIETHLSKEYSPYSLSQMRQWSRKSLHLTLSFVVYCPEILQQRMLDQLILCSMYGVSKFLKMSIRFHELIQAYNKSVITKPSQFERTILSVKSNFSSTQNDIIGFYNSEFIGYLNYAFEIIGYKQKMQVIFQLCGDFCEEDMYTSPFRYAHQAIILSPKLKKSKSQTHSFKSVERIVEKQNYERNTGHSININLDHQGHLGIVSYISQEVQQSLGSSHSEGKIEINLEINQGNSRNPTRVKERKGIQERENELCATHKGKHPIFAQLRKIDEE